MDWVGKKVHLGCGVHLLSGWVNVDAAPLPGVDVALDLHTGLGQIPDNQVEWVYASHILEHIYPNVLPEVMSHLYRMLRPDGVLTVATIDINGIYNDWYKSGAANGTAWTSALYGSVTSRDNPLDAHRDCFDFPKLARIFATAGFRNVRGWEYAKYPQLAALNDCGLSCRAVSVLVEGDK